MARKKSALREKKFYLARKIFYLRCKTTIFSRFFQEKRGGNPASTGFLLFAIQIYNIFGRNPNCFNIWIQFRNVKMQRFAQARVRHVLYYEGDEPSQKKAAPVGRSLIGFPTGRDYLAALLAASIISLEGRIYTSTRRFCWRPSAVSLLATGFSWPRPVVYLM